MVFRVLKGIENRPTPEMERRLAWMVRAVMSGAWLACGGQRLGSTVGRAVAWTGRGKIAG